MRADGLRSGVPATEDARPDAWQPSAATDEPSSAAITELAALATAVQGAPVGDADRSRRGRQDAACAGGRRAAHRRLPGRSVGDRAGRGQRSGRGARGGGGRARHHPAAGHDASRQRGRRPRGPIAAAGLRQLRARPRRCGRPRSTPSSAARRRADPRDQPGRLAGGRRAGVAGAAAWTATAPNPPAVDAVRRARHAVAPGHPLREDRDAIVEICRRLDGIPLALELAASRMPSMTVTECGTGSMTGSGCSSGRAGAATRHHTLRHAVQWSYDLLDDAEKTIARTCSVFAGGFDLAAADAVTATGDEVATLRPADALVRKSLLVADRSSSRTRYSMLETIRQFGEEQLETSGADDRCPRAHACYFAGLENEVLARWDGPRQREAYEWFTDELANLRAAFRWAADSGDLDTAATIAVYAAFLGGWIEQHEPIAWAEALIDTARAVDHQRLEPALRRGRGVLPDGRIDAGRRVRRRRRRADHRCGRYLRVAVRHRADRARRHLHHRWPRRAMARAFAAQHRRAAAEHIQSEVARDGAAHLAVDSEQAKVACRRATCAHRSHRQPRCTCLRVPRLRLRADASTTPPSHTKLSVTACDRLRPAAIG